jgi:hypothetical protein
MHRTLRAVALLPLLILALLIPSPAHGWIEVCKLPEHQWVPAVCFRDSQYLVAWADNRDRAQDSSTNIYGGRIGRDGRVLDAGGFLVVGSLRDKLDPKIRPSSAGWTVVYQDAC